jgi:hypothetical protein
LLGNNKQTIPEPTQYHVYWNAIDLPLALKISSDFDPQEITLIEDAASEWSLAIDQELNFFQIPLDETPNKDLNNLDLYRDNEIGMYKSYQWFEGIGSYVLALTQYFGFKNGNEVSLIHGDIVFNYRDHDWSLVQSASTFDLPSVAIHELGHLLGLFHEYDFSVDSVMHPSIQPEYISRIPFAIDKENIIENYQHEFNQSISGFSMSHSMSQNNGPQNPGELIRGLIELTIHGRCRHFQNGEMIFEHQL